MSTWSKFGAHGEHGDVFLFSNLGALWFSENLIRYSLHICLREVKNNLFFLQTLLFTAFHVAVLRILTYALVSTWSSVSSGWEHVKRKMHPCSLLTGMMQMQIDKTKIPTKLTQQHRTKFETLKSTPEIDFIFFFWRTKWVETTHERSNETGQLCSKGWFYNFPQSQREWSLPIIIFR